MADVYYEQDADFNLLNGEVIGIIGYGSQGHAHALNLKDSGANVMVGLYKGSSSWEKAEADGLKVATVEEVAEQASIIMMLIPDTKQKEVYENSIKQHLTAGKTLMFAHGFNIHYNQINPPSEIDVTMIAPKAPGHRVRQLFEKGVGTPALLAIHQDASETAKGQALAYAKGIGATKAGVLETSFGEETETDLFGEQAVLCGGQHRAAQRQAAHLHQGSRAGGRHGAGCADHVRPRSDHAGSPALPPDDHSPVGTGQRGELGQRRVLAPAGADPRDPFPRVVAGGNRRDP